MFICEFCGKEHDGTYGTGRFCSRACASNYSGNIFKEKYKNKLYTPKLEIRICPKCGKEFTIDLKKSKRIYCSRSCANAHVITEEHKEKTRQSMYKYLLKSNKNNQKKTYRLTCIICGNSFYHKNKHAKCCSKECSSKLGVQTKRKNGTYIGGYRENSSYGKSGWYKGIHCHSTYELAWVIYNLDHNIKFERCKKVFDYEYQAKQHKYYPDFELEDGTIIEIKGYYIDVVDIKEKVVKDAGYKYQILYKNDLQYCFDYIKERYKTSDIAKLYDDCEGYITKVCEYCGKQYKTRNKNQRCCSRSCIGHITKNSLGGKHMVNDISKEHKVIVDANVQKELLSKGWRFGCVFR